MNFRTAMICSLAALTAPLAASAQEARVEVGYLKCDQTGTGGNFLRATEEFNCVFDSADAGIPDEIYSGKVAKWGITLTNVTQQTIRWVVLAPTTQTTPGALNGDYAGLSADLALGAGIGVNALVGGLDESIALQPLSVSTQTGVGLAAGVKTMTLTHIP